jgi:hypothetical protein
MILSMTKEERTKLYIAHSLIDRKTSIREAAEISGLSERQWKRIKKGVSEQGDAFVIHKSRGKKPPNAVSDEVKNKVLSLRNSSDYDKSNFSHFQELIGERESLVLSKPTVYRILISNNFTSPRKHTRINTHKRRRRKPRRGMLIIADASPHHWFFDEREFSLHGAVDDATGEILSLFFTPNECMEGYFEVVRDIVTNHGVPLALYVDRHTIFRSPVADKLTTEDELSGSRVKDTQFGRAMREIGINLIYARSSQAKGRIEKLWGTLQSRLPVELNLAGIKTAEEANVFLKLFIVKYNERFAVGSKEPENDFRKLDKRIRLDYILCIKETRKVDNGSAFSYKGSFYSMICSNKAVPVIPKAGITVLESRRIGIKVLYSGRIYDTELLDEKPKKQPGVKEKPAKEPRHVKPSPTHPWYHSTTESNSSFASSLLEESDREILEALYSSRCAWR